MAAAVEPWGLTPLTTEGLAKLGHPLSVSDFNQDASGRYWRMIRGQKTYYPKEWFASTGLFTGPHTQAGDRAGQDKSFFKEGVHWNWEKGEWENPTNWANVIGTTAAGVVGGGAIAALAGGAGAGAGGVGIGETGATTGIASGAGLPGAVAAPAVSDLVEGGSAIAGGGLVGGGGLASTAASWLTKAGVVPALAQTIGGIWAANKQAGASEEALKQQQEQFDKAIEVAKEEQTYNRNQYGDYLGRLSPYMASGNDANYRESQYMAQPSASGGFPRPSSVAPPTPMPGSGPAAAVAPAATPGGGMAPTAGGSTTRMRSPDGAEQDVPTAQVQHYLDMGATVIGNRYTTMGQ